MVAVALLLILLRKKPAEPTVESEQVEQHKVTWFLMKGTAVYDVDAARVGEDGSAQRLTKPVVPGSAPAGALAGEPGVPLLPKAQGVEGVQPERSHGSVPGENGS